MITHVLLVEHPPAVCGPLQARLALEPDLKVIGEAGDGPTAAQLAQTLAPHVVVVDAEMPGLDVRRTVRAIRELSPSTAVVVLSVHASAVRRSLGAEPTSVVGKHEGVAPLLAAIRNAGSRVRGESTTAPPAEAEA
jgi:DNA-binding NarL/FixJ family response regulator